MDKEYLTKDGQLKAVLSVLDLNQMSNEGIEIKFSGRTEYDPHKKAIANFNFGGKKYEYQLNFHSEQQYPDNLTLIQYVKIPKMN